MKNRIQLILLSMIAAVGLSNCIDIHQVVKVKKDGSGTIEETMLISMSPDLAAFGGGEQDPIAMMTDPEKMKKRAKGLGEGVEFVSAEPFEGKNGAKGLKTLFKFSDISKVKLSADAGIAELNPRAKKATEGKKGITFGFEGGETSKLTVNMPQLEGIDGMEQANDPTVFAMVSQFIKGMRLRITVKPEGKITKTNATYSDTDSVTLADIEMDKLLKDHAKFKEFSEIGKEKDRKKVAAKLKEIGIKGEAKEQVSIEFK